MKTQKRFFITNMSKCYKILGICLILAALVVNMAHAQETIVVNPGDVGVPNDGLVFRVSAQTTGSIKLKFSDNKTLKAGPGKTSFMLTNLAPSRHYSGVLLDAYGEEIPGTEFEGITDLIFADIDLQEATVWYSILISGYFQKGPQWLIWTDGRPTVGEGEIDPATVGGTVTGLVGSGLVLQNNGADDLPIETDGEFTFATPLAPGESYNVTVLTQPSMRQTCEVQNGSGEVADVNVTDVVVACISDDTVVIFEGNNATGIKNLDVDGKRYHVEFLYDSAENIYGASPIFDFQNDIEAEAARSAVIAALNREPAVWTVGPEGANQYLIGFTLFEYYEDIYVVGTQDYYDDVDGTWAQDNQSLRSLYGMATWADFTEVPVPPPATAPVPKTGQTLVFAQGDDGDLQKGVPWPEPRFTDNDDGTVRDNLTGLIWIKSPESCPGGGNGGWEDALQKANNLADGECGLTDGSQPGDWRLPNVRELQSLIDYGEKHEALPDDHPFNVRHQFCSPETIYWTSTVICDADLCEGSVELVWVMEICFGEASLIDDESTADQSRIWAVRGGN